jgi:GNAT superfamily N-acetyltransferase
MDEEPGFRKSVGRHIQRSAALVAEAMEPQLLGGLLFGGPDAGGDTERPAGAAVYHVHWLVVTEATRGGGVGRALMAAAMSRVIRRPATVEVVTFAIIRVRGAWCAGLLRAARICPG